MSGSSESESELEAAGAGDGCGAEDCATGWEIGFSVEGSWARAVDGATRHTSSRETAASIDCVEESPIG